MSAITCYTPKQVFDIICADEDNTERVERVAIMLQSIQNGDYAFLQLNTDSFSFVSYFGWVRANEFYSLTDFDTAYYVSNGSSLQH